jgi:hypothetical protein
MCYGTAPFDTAFRNSGERNRPGRPTQDALHTPKREIHAPYENGVLPIITAL